MCFRTRGNFSKSKISHICLLGMNTFFVHFSAFPIYDFGIDHYGSRPFIYSVQTERERVCVLENGT